MKFPTHLVVDMHHIGLPRIRNEGSQFGDFPFMVLVERVVDVGGNERHFFIGSALEVKQDAILVIVDVEDVGLILVDLLEVRRN
jgi:hypothetical protein